MHNAFDEISTLHSNFVCFWSTTVDICCFCCGKYGLQSYQSQSQCAYLLFTDVSKYGSRLTNISHSAALDHGIPHSVLGLNAFIVFVFNTSLILQLTV